MVNPSDESIVNASNLKEIEIELSSTNDLSYPCFKTNVQYGSNLIQLLQFIIFILLINENSSDFSRKKTFPLILGKVFIYFYLTLSLPDSLSAILKLKMRLYTPTVQSEARTLMRGPNENKNIFQSFLDSIMFFVHLVFNWFTAYFTLICFSLKEFLNPEDHVLIGREVPFYNRLLRLWSEQLESCNYILSIIAVVIITEQQNTLINILFNFAGVLVVSSLDEILILSFPKTSIKIFVKNTFENLKPALNEASCEIGVNAFTSGFVTLLLVIFGLIYEK